MSVLAPRIGGSTAQYVEMRPESPGSHSKGTVKWGIPGKPLSNFTAEGNHARKKSGMRALASVAIFLAFAFGAARAALAIPVFANGQGGVSCALCHTTVPQLNSYGRYVLMTNFSRGLNKHLQIMQNRSLPVALETTANASSQPVAMLPGVYSALVQFLSGGYAGSDVSYFASVPIETDGFPADAVDQVWAAYNGFSHGNASFQIGKFPTPIFAPWMSQPLSLSGYALVTLPVGLNGSTSGDNRWGASYTQIGRLGLIGNVSYLGGSGPIERAFNTAGEGTAWTGSLQYLSPESRWSGGVAGLIGSNPLPSGENDRYAREMALASYGADRYEVTAMGLLGQDSSPNGGASPVTNSRGFSLETIYGILPWLRFDVRYEHTDDGLGTSTTNYISDVAVSLRPNVIMTVEDRSSAGTKATLNYQLLWAGPWYRDRFPPGTMPGAVPTPTTSSIPASSTTSRPSAMPKSSAMPMPVPIVDSKAIANGRSIYFSGTDLDGTPITTANPFRVYQSCAVCHGPDGGGGVQLADGTVSAKLGPNAHMLDQMGSMNGKQVPWTLALFERAISSGLDENGGMLNPVMPRWKMSKRDLHDIALYVLTQIH